MLEYVISGLLTLLVGLMSLFVDPKNDKKKAWWVIGALVVSSSVTAAYGYYDSNDSKSKADQLIDVSQKTLDKSAELEKTNARLEKNVEALMAHDNLPVAEGDLPGPTTVTTEAQKPSKATPLPAPIIEYFAKDAESDTVTKALRDKGLEVVRLRSGRPGPTNSIWAGDAVTAAEVRPVALAVLEAGVQLRSVRHFASGRGAKDRLIEIGSDAEMERNGAPVYTTEQIEKMTEIPAH